MVYKVYKDTLTAENSPIELMLRDDLGKNSTDGFVANDGDGDIDMQLCFNSEYGDTFPLKPYESFPSQCDNFAAGIVKIKLSHSGKDASFRAMFT